eukprot:4995543-Prymnesium_polylepis.1
MQCCRQAGSCSTPKGRTCAAARANEMFSGMPPHCTLHDCCGFEPDNLALSRNAFAPSVSHLWLFTVPRWFPPPCQPQKSSESSESSDVQPQSTSSEATTSRSGTRGASGP